ncbi:glycosyltransferase [Curtobacterium albidum]|uniref:glycosyltransferase n=1 Tax=Curtobacterium citreum TaxID=2036 RepID=UPI002026477A|nr:glycosyltransferase [Curtobacterium albidum]MCL9664420.1 glycosyltransferase [Curtobacterium albidum]
MPAEGWYFKTNYDITENVPPAFVPMSTIKALRTLAFADVETLEVPELLWARELPRTLALLVVHKSTSRRSAARVFYAIENNDPATALLGSRKVPKWFSALLRAGIGFAARWLIDAVVYGSEGSRRAYQGLPLVRGLKSTLIEELPGRPTKCAPLKDRRDAVFVGALETRKGVPALMDAWETIEADHPGRQLRIIGNGELAFEVRTWSDKNPAQRSFLGQLPHSQVHDVLTQSAVLVAPSLREGRWREQIGLPIKEALRAGVTVVSTPDTGLADWLTKNGHHVVQSEALAGALAAALSAPLDPAEVIRSLPRFDGRVAADHWLRQNTGTAS